MAVAWVPSFVRYYPSQTLHNSAFPSAHPPLPKFSSALLATSPSSPSSSSSHHPAAVCLSFTEAIDLKKPSFIAPSLKRKNGTPRKRSAAKVSEAAEARAIEEEQMLSEAPASLLREGEAIEGEILGGCQMMRARYEEMIRRAQDEICEAVEAVDGGKFREDVWTRPGGGGGISRVLQNGKVWEKAGVNVSVVYGTMPPEAYRAATGSGNAAAVPVNKSGRIPFFAAGISSVMHPHNPFAPTVHFNFRYFETDTPKGVEGAPRSWWFGGGTDLTPSYIIEEDISHFHKIQKMACDKFDKQYYPDFKKWCDDYFLIKHRGERRGVGGIFFDDLNNCDPEDLLGFSTECTRSVIPAYLPIIKKRKDTPFTQAHKDWQQLRRGRYVEFNLVYDRGTTFGLKTGGRIESILMSLPLTARWEYDHHPEKGTEEWKLLDVCKNPTEWV